MTMQPVKAGDVVFAVPWRACLFHPSAPVLSTVGISERAGQRRPFQLAPNTFAAATTITHRRPRVLEVPPLDSDPAAPQLPLPTPDSDLDVALALVFASLRYKVAVGAAIPGEAAPFASYATQLEGEAAGLGIGMVGDEIALNASMWQLALSGLCEESLVDFVASNLLVEDGEHPSSGDALVAAACRTLFPLPTDDAELADLTESERKGFVVEALGASIGSALHDARRRVRLLRTPATSSRLRLHRRSPYVEAFVPFADLMAHATESPSCSVEIDPESQSVLVRARRSLRKREELTVALQTRASSELERQTILMTRYGVAPP
jgi:hypothetical protein